MSNIIIPKQTQSLSYSPLNSICRPVFALAFRLMDHGIEYTGQWLPRGSRPQR